MSVSQETAVNVSLDSENNTNSFYHKNLSDVKIKPKKNQDNKKLDTGGVESKKKNKKDKSDCLNLKKTLLSSSPKLVILKSAEDLCAKTFEIGVKKPISECIGSEESRLSNNTGASRNADCFQKLLVDGSSVRKADSDGKPYKRSPDGNSGRKAPSPSPDQEKTSHKGLLTFIFGSLVMAILAALSFIWTPYDILMNERLKMVRGLPAYEWWKNPPDEVLLRVYVFNITNPQEFLNGKDKKLRLQEIGPFIFREKLRHTNVEFHENGTMTYTAHRTAIFLPEMNHLSLNATLVIPNLAVLGMSSYLSDAAFLTKLGFNLLISRMDSQPLVTSTVYDYFWNLTDPLVKVGKKLAPHLVPAENMGILYQIYHNFTDEVTVYMGPGNGRRFFTVDQFHGSPRFGYWQNETCDSVQGATEGVTYHQYISKQDTLKYLRKTICRVTPLYYSHDLLKLGMTAYRFDLPPNIFARPEDENTEECFIQPDVPSLPSGLTDVSPCYYDFPVAASFPHFMHADKEVQEGVDGLSPDVEKHGSFVIVEPTTGVPMESRARSQSNLVIRPLSGFPKIKKFSSTIIPMFWAEYNQVGLPWYIAGLMYFTVVILPATQMYLSSIFLILWTSLTCLFTYKYIQIKEHEKRPLYSYSSLDLIPSSSSTNSEC